MPITADQYRVLTSPLRNSRVATRSQGGKTLSYVEAWDIKAHLTRIFGFGNYDSEMLECAMLYQRDIEVGSEKRPGWEVAWMARLRLVVRDQDGEQLAVYCEAAVGSATGSAGLGDLHDNALKQAASDALKRCAINLGTQFGLSLYDNGTRADVIQRCIVVPSGIEPAQPQDAATSPEHDAATQHTVGRSARPTAAQRAVANATAATGDPGDPLTDPADRMGGAVR